MMVSVNVEVRANNMEVNEKGTLRIIVPRESFFYCTTTKRHKMCGTREETAVSQSYQHETRYTAPSRHLVSYAGMYTYMS